MQWLSSNKCLHFAVLRMIIEAVSNPPYVVSQPQNTSNTSAPGLANTTVTTTGNKASTRHIPVAAATIASTISTTNATVNTSQGVASTGAWRKGSGPHDLSWSHRRVVSTVQGPATIFI